jgi:hypothetical protein
VGGIGWVLPFSTGAGLEVCRRPDWLGSSPELNAALNGFDAKPYLSSVKGYLDPASAFCLAAASLALGELAHASGGMIRERFGASTISRYGAPASGYKFYEQFLSKGARLASPLVFPHGYSNTAGNLAAIEFGLGGPHLVLYGTSAVSEAFDFALNRLDDGTADHMLVAAYEAVTPEAVPDGLDVLNGAVAVWLTTDAASPPLTGAEPESLRRSHASVDTGGGSVRNLLALLQAPLVPRGSQGKG